MEMITMAEWKPTLYQYWNIFKVLFSRRLTYGKYTRKLEEEFAKIHNRKYALFTSSGTSALKIALQALKEKNGWKDGDEVIIPSVTFVATMNVVLYNGLKPVFVDVEYDGNISPFKIREAITDRTVAIMPVHLFGKVAHMRWIKDLADEHNLKVVEDSCETMFINGKAKGDIICYSSYIAHLMVTGVGGFICTDDKELATYMRSLMFHGRDDSYLTIDDNKKGKEVIHKRFLFEKQGHSDRLTEIEAVLGLGDLKRWEWIVKKRQENARYLFYKLPVKVKMMFAGLDIKNHAFMFFPMMVDNRDEIMLKLEERGIHTRTAMPLLSQPIVKKLFGDIEDDYPMAKSIRDKGLLIGCHQYLKKKDLDFIIKTIRSLV